MACFALSKSNFIPGLNPVFLNFSHDTVILILFSGGQLGLEVGLGLELGLEVGLGGAPILYSLSLAALMLSLEPALAVGNFILKK